MTDAQMQFPHRRYDPLRGRWVLVSPHRTQRPWQGEVSRTDTKAALHYDPECYLCPGNTRAGGKQNPPYTSVFSFTNDYAALMPEAPAIVRENASELLRAETERGICKVLCFHPDHSPDPCRDGGGRHRACGGGVDCGIPGVGCVAGNSPCADL